MSRLPHVVSLPCMQVQPATGKQWACLKSMGMTFGNFHLKDLYRFPRTCHVTDLDHVTLSTLDKYTAVYGGEKN